MRLWAGYQALAAAVVIGLAPGCAASPQIDEARSVADELEAFAQPAVEGEFCDPMSELDELDRLSTRVSPKTDLPYSPTCDIASRVQGSIDRIKAKFPGSTIIWLEPPTVVVTGTVPHRVLEVRLNFVLVKSKPEKDPNGGGLKGDVELVIVNFDAWAAANGFEQEEIKNIRLRLEKDGLAVSGDYTFKKHEAATATHSTRLVKLVFPAGTNYDVVKEHVDKWEANGVPGDRVVIKK